MRSTRTASWRTSRRLAALCSIAATLVLAARADAVSIDAARIDFGGQDLSAILGAVQPGGCLGQDASGNWINAACSAGSAAPPGATYVTLSPDAGLTNELALSTLGAGLLLNSPPGTLAPYGGASCAAGQAIQALDALGAATCVAVGGGGGSSIVLDLGDDGLNESTALAEIATVGDTNGIFSEPSADKLLISVSTPWPTCDALAADPADCPAGQVAVGITASGAAVCVPDDDQPDSDAEVPDAITVSLSAGGRVVGGTASRCARFDASGNLVAATGDCPDGDTGGLPSAVDDQTLVHNGTAFVPVTIPPCSSEANTLGYDAATNSFVCLADAGAGGGMTSWTAAADSGTSQPVTDAETVTFSGGAGISTSVSTPDAGASTTVTFASTGEMDTDGDGAADSGWTSSPLSVSVSNGLCRVERGAVLDCTFDASSCSGACNAAWDAFWASVVSLRAAACPNGGQHACGITVRFAGEYVFDLEDGGAIRIDERRTIVDFGTSTIRVQSATVPTTTVTINATTAGDYRLTGAAGAFAAVETGDRIQVAGDLWRQVARKVSDTEIWLGTPVGVSGATSATVATGSLLVVNTGHIEVRGGYIYCESDCRPSTAPSGFRGLRTVPAAAVVVENASQVKFVRTYVNGFNHPGDACFVIGRVGANSDPYTAFDHVVCEQATGFVLPDYVAEGQRAEHCDASGDPYPECTGVDTCPSCAGQLGQGACFEVFENDISIELDATMPYSCGRAIIAGYQQGLHVDAGGGLEGSWQFLVAPFGVSAQIRAPYTEQHSWTPQDKADLSVPWIDIGNAGLSYPIRLRLDAVNLNTSAPRPFLRVRDSGGNITLGITRLSGWGDLMDFPGGAAQVDGFIGTCIAGSGGDCAFEGNNLSVFFMDGKLYMNTAPIEPWVQHDAFTLRPSNAIIDNIKISGGSSGDCWRNGTAGTVGLDFSCDATNDYAFTASSFATPAGVIAGSSIANDAITASHIAVDAVGASEIAADAVGSSEIAEDAVGTSELADGTDTPAADEVVAVDPTDTTRFYYRPDDDVPESGDFGNAADLDASGSIVADAVGSAEIADGSILEVDLSATNVPTGGECLTYDSVSGGFTWAACGTGGASEWTDEGTVLRPADATDDWIRVAGDVGAARIGQPTAGGDMIFDVDSDGAEECRLSTGGTLTCDSIVSLCDPATEDCFVDLTEDSGVPGPSTGSVRLIAESGELYKRDSTDSSQQLICNVGNEATASDITLTESSGTVDYQIKAGAVGSTEIADGGVTWASDIADDLGCTGGQAVRRNLGDTAWECFTPGTGGGGYATVQEEGTALTQRTVLNFIGPAVTAADDAVNSRTNVTITASGVGSCTNQVVTALNDGAAPTCSNVTSAMIATGAVTWADDIADDLGCLAGDSIRRNATDTGWECYAPGGGGGTGDVTDVGDCITGACFTADGTGTGLYFEGTTADTAEVFLTTEDPVADVTVTIPAATGRVVLEDLTQTLTNKTIDTAQNALISTGSVTLPAKIWSVPTANAPAASTYGTNFPRDVFDFAPAPAADESLSTVTVLPGAYDQNSLSVEIEWAPASAGTAGQNVCWCVQAADVANLAAEDPAAEETVCGVTALSGTADRRHRTVLALTPSNYAAGNQLLVRIYRDTGTVNAACTGTLDTSTTVHFIVARIVARMTE